MVRHDDEKHISVSEYGEWQGQLDITVDNINKKLSYCWETVRRESMPSIAEMDVEMTT